MSQLPEGGQLPATCGFRRALDFPKYKDEFNCGFKVFSLPAIFEFFPTTSGSGRALDFPKYKDEFKDLKI